jgi:hypothetical protein
MEVVTRNDHRAYSEGGAARVHRRRGEESGRHAHGLGLMIPMSRQLALRNAGKVNSHAGHMKVCDPNDRRWEGSHA